MTEVMLATRMTTEEVLLPGLRDLRMKTEEEEEVLAEEEEEQAVALEDVSSAVRMVISQETVLIKLPRVEVEADQVLVEVVQEPASNAIKKVISQETVRIKIKEVGVLLLVTNVNKRATCPGNAQIKTNQTEEEVEEEVVEH